MLSFFFFFCVIDVAGVFCAVMSLPQPITSYGFINSGRKTGVGQEHDFFFKESVCVCLSIHFKAQMAKHDPHNQSKTIIFFNMLSYIYKHKGQNHTLCTK